MASLIVNSFKLNELGVAARCLSTSERLTEAAATPMGVALQSTLEPEELRELITANRQVIA